MGYEGGIWPLNEAAPASAVFKDKGKTYIRGQLYGVEDYETSASNLYGKLIPITGSKEYDIRKINVNNPTNGTTTQIYVAASEDIIVTSNDLHICRRNVDQGDAFLTFYDETNPSSNVPSDFNVASVREVYWNPVVNYTGSISGFIV